MMNKQQDYAPSGTVGRPRTDREPVTVRLGKKQLAWVDHNALKQLTGRSDIIRQAIALAMELDND